MMQNIGRWLSVVRTRILIPVIYRKQFRIIKDTIKLADKIGKDQTNGLNWDDSKPFNKVLIVAFAKNIHRLRSIKLLCLHGFAKDAIPLLRSIFEELADIKYMQADKKRIQDFIDYDSYLRLKHAEILSKSTSPAVDKKKLSQRNKELQTEWNKVKSRFTYKNHNGKEKVYNRWTCKSVEAVSQAVGFGEIYSYIFGYLSNFIHHTTLVGHDYVLGRVGDHVVISVGTNMQFIEETLPTAGAMFLDILGIINEECEMHIDDSLKNLSDRIALDRQRYSAKTKA